MRSAGFWSGREGRHTDRVVIGERLKAAIEAYASSRPGAVVTGGSLRRSVTITFPSDVDVDVLPVFPAAGKGVRPRWLGALVNSSLAASGVGRRGFLQLLTEGSTTSDALGAGLDGPVDVRRWNRVVAELVRSFSSVAATPVRPAALPDSATRVLAFRLDDACPSSSRRVELRLNPPPISPFMERIEALAQRVGRFVTNLELLLRVTWQLLLTGRRGDPATQSMNALLKREHRSADLSLLTRSPGGVVTSSGRVPRGPDSLRVTSNLVIRGELVRTA